MLNLVAEISAKIERYAIVLEQDASLRLRKANRVKTIHSSLAIEGNGLTEGQVRDIVNGKNVVAPLREIQEVKNAIATYDLFPSLNPFDEKDLLRAHQAMMQALVDNPGRWRASGVGVFGEKGCLRMAPPAERVPQLMADLFEWLKNADDHLLIRSCVFHYEFEFIHPFLDGNGRTGRLWQSLILSRLHPLFAHLPVENMVYANQQAYYDVISASTAVGESTSFIEFMLSEILATLTRGESDSVNYKVEYVPIKVQGIFPNNIPNIFPNNVQSQYPSVSEAAWHIASLYDNTPGASADQIGEALGISGRMVRNHTATLRKLGIIERIGSNKTGYWKVNRIEGADGNESL
ncbi:MAG: Fic family protein [Lachnospiraceae bacterium]|nr:Fic family protein [Lachnospiraceae bacterium]